MLENQKIYEKELEEVVKDFIFKRTDEYYDAGAIIEEQDVFFDVSKMEGCLEYKVIDTINKVMETGIKPSLIFINEKTIQVSWGFVNAKESVVYNRFAHLQIRCDFIKFVSQIELPIKYFKEAEEFQAETKEQEIEVPGFTKRLFDSGYVQVYFEDNNFRNKDNIACVLRNIFIAKGMKFNID